MGQIPRSTERISSKDYNSKIFWGGDLTALQTPSNSNTQNLKRRPHPWEHPPAKIVDTPVEKVLKQVVITTSEETGDSVEGYTYPFLNY